MDRDDGDLQSDFLTVLVSNQTPVWVFLVNGIKLSGVISSFDKFSLSIRSGTDIQMVFKSAVSTVIEQHARPVLSTQLSAERPRRGPSDKQP
ncbi:RNA-binding protein Hfq [Caballeronia fortuita]|uniref:RNA-binding protein Hfq n=1 Tax=Caballeronia fortuita TaxID=1777138 RepID=A0A157ZBM7_9BURK|nr:RNA chaperone Hfq [Caballeronia fortuita]SAK42924.1 RNA-binding protein Hfq [Caballeronia fortuita]